MAKQVCAWFVVLLLIAMIGLASCSPKDEETAIRALVKKGATLGEEQDIKILYRLKLECSKRNGDWLERQERLERFTGTSFTE